MKSYVNLVPADIKRHASSIKMLRRWYLLTIAVVVLGIILVCPCQASLQVLTHQIFEIAPAAHRSQLVEKQLDELNHQINRMNLARNRHISMTGLFPPLASLSVVSEFCARHPDAIQITSIDYSNNRFPKREDLPHDIIETAEENSTQSQNSSPPQPTENLGTIVIRAKLTDPALATTLLGALKTSKLFKEVTLMNHNVDREEETYTSSIDLTCKF